MRTFWMYAVIVICSAAAGRYVAAAQAGSTPAAAGPAMTTVWDGVFTEAQATRGEATYFEECASCHGQDLVGGDGSPAPPIVGDMFLDALAGSSVADFFEIVRTTMPLDSPGRLSRRQYADIVAYIFRVNRVPAGTEELGTALAMLAQIGIPKRPAGK